MFGLVGSFDLRGLSAVLGGGEIVRPCSIVYGILQWCTTGEGASYLSNKDLDNSVVKNEFFLNNLEQWMDAAICQDRLTGSEIIWKVKASFRRAMQANIDHH